MPVKPVIEFLYTNIGRGHPFYLDGITDALIHLGQVKLVRHQQDVFELSSGLSLVGWKLARWLYQSGSSGGPAGAIYSRLRGGDYNRPGVALRIMGRQVRKRFLPTDSPLLVAHPTLVGVLGGRPNLIYQHGELVAPPESLVRGAAFVMVPTKDVARRFVEAGCSEDALFISGLCVEPSLIRQAEDAYRLRRSRLESDVALTGAFFSSGAEPADHVAQLAKAAVSVSQAGHSAIVFAREGGRFEAAAAEAFHRAGILPEQIDSRGWTEVDSFAAAIVAYDSRRALNALTARLFPRFDFFAAPSHERVNWAVGLGLPMFVVEPCIGPFAGLNRDLVLQHGTAQLLQGDSTVERLGELVSELRRQNRLSEMAEAGWDRYPIDGFSRIAAWLVERFGGGQN